VTTFSILDAARDAPAGVALSDGLESTSFRELAERVRERMRPLESWARASALPPRLVAVSTGEQRCTIELLLALMELGIPFLPLHERATVRERESLLAAAPVAALLEVSASDFVTLTPRAGQLDALAEQLMTRTPALAALATSGSTGAPRLALLSRAAFQAAAAASAARLGWQHHERWLLCLPLAHIGGLSVVTRCLLARRTVALLPPAAAQSSSERLASGIERSLPTLISMVPAQLDGLLQLEPRFELPGSVRAILTGGAAASGGLLERCAGRGWPVLTSYGLTEACSQVATQVPGTSNRGQLGVGLPLPGIGVHIDDGVIRITGPTLASAYLGSEGAQLIDGELGFRTRDLGRFDSSGRLHVLGRVDELIISGGENVSPFEVEAALERCPGVLEVCAFKLPDARFGEVVGVGLRTRSADAAALIAAADREARIQLAPFKRPRFYICVEAFAHGPTGKLDRAATARELRARVEASPGQYRSPSAKPASE
jgi:O-succinylbenzoic acid--CoA ligase